MYPRAEARAQWPDATRLSQLSGRFGRRMPDLRAAYRSRINGTQGRHLSDGLAKHPATCRATLKRSCPATTHKRRDRDGND